MTICKNHFTRTCCWTRASHLRPATWHIRVFSCGYGFLPALSGKRKGGGHFLQHVCLFQHHLHRPARLLRRFLAKQCHPHALFITWGALFGSDHRHIRPSKGRRNGKKHKILSFSTLEKPFLPVWWALGRALLASAAAHVCLKGMQIPGESSARLLPHLHRLCVYKIGLKNLRLSKDMLCFIGRLLVNPALVKWMAACSARPRR